MGKKNILEETRPIHYAKLYIDNMQINTYIIYMSIHKYEYTVSDN